MNQTIDMQEKAKEIATYLEGFEYVQPSEETTWRKWAVLRHQDGREIRIFEERNGRASVSGGYNPKDGGSLSSFVRYEECPKIGFSPSKPAEALARDIAKRFLPKYTELWIKAMELLKRKQESNAREDELFSELGKILGLPTKNHSGQSSIYLNGSNIYGTIEPYGENSITMNLRHLPAPLGKRICEIVAEYMAQTSEKESE